MPFVLQGNAFLLIFFASNIVAFIIYWSISYYFLANYYYRKQSTMNEWKCQPDRTPSKKIIHRDFILGSFDLLMLSSLTAFFIYWLVLKGYTKIYFIFNEHSILFTLLTSIFYILLLDLSLYWAHRLFHLPFLFRKIHYLHHRTGAPVALTAFAMHPLEALTYHFLTFLPFFILPLYFLSAIIILLYTYYVSLIDHSGVKNHPWFFWQSPAKFHDDHHRFFHVNYGQTFWFWDYVFGSWRRQGIKYTVRSFETRKQFRILLTKQKDYVDYQQQ